MFFHYRIILQVRVHLQYGSMDNYHMKFDMLKNAKLTGPMNSGWLGSDSGSSQWLVRVDFRMSLLVMVPHCLNILQMDKSHQQVTVHQSIRYHSDNKLIQTDTKPTFSNSFSSQLSHTSELAQNSQRLRFKP